MSLYRPGVGYGEPTCPLATRRHPEQPGSVLTGVTGQAPTQTLYDKSSPGGAWMQVMPVPPRDVCCQVCSCQNRVESTSTKNSILPNQPCIRSRSCISYGGRQFTVPAVWPLDYFRSNSAHKNGLRVSLNSGCCFGREGSARQSACLRPADSKADY